VAPPRKRRGREYAVERVRGAPSALAWGVVVALPRTCLGVGIGTLLGVRRQPRIGRALVALGVVVATGVAACGGGTSAPTPAQSEPSQRIQSYVEAVNKAGSSFHGAATAPLLRTAIAELAAIVPPAAFRTSYARLIGSIRGELSAVNELEKGEQTHDASLVSSAEAAKVKQVNAAHAALAEASSVLTKCEQDNFSC
jgi:hypothetical protein